MAGCFCTGFCRKHGYCPNAVIDPQRVPNPFKIGEEPKPTGWICPVCKIGVSPFVSSCPNCQKGPRGPEMYDEQPKGMNGPAGP